MTRACTLAEIAQRLGGELSGDGDMTIVDVSTLGDGRDGHLTFIDHADKLPRLARDQSSAAIVPRGVVCEGKHSVAVDNVHKAFAEMVRWFRPPRAARRVGVSPRAIVSETARIADDVDIHAGAIIGDEVEIGRGATIHGGANIMVGSKIGEGATIFPNAVLYENTVVGPRSIVHAGAVLGAYGFGYKLHEGRYQLSQQLGHVVLGADVEVGAGTTIDRGTYGATSIGEGTKIDNQVQIGHNCVMGKHNMICSQVGVAGSTTTGDYVVMAGQVGVRDHVHIGDRAVLGAMCGVSNDVEAGAHMLGTPAVREREQKVLFACYFKLPELRKQVKSLERSVAALEERVAPTVHERGQQAA